MALRSCRELLKRSLCAVASVTLGPSSNIEGKSKLGNGLLALVLVLVAERLKTFIVEWLDFSFKKSRDRRWASGYIILSVPRVCRGFASLARTSKLLELARFWTGRGLGVGLALSLVVC